MQTAGGTVPGDVTPLSTAGGDGADARRGPRHAAPRKSLLTKLQMPAGKAMALAAMPTAVFVGMSLAPRLALADDKDIPFAPGPCVTRSDEPSESESPSPSDSAKPSDEASDESSDKKSDEPSAKPSGSASDAADDSGQTRDEPKPAESPSASESAAEGDSASKPAEDAEDSESGESKSLLDPLGLGDKIKDLFDGSDGSDDEESAAEPAASESAKPTDEPSDEPTADQSESESTSDDEDPARDEADEPDKTDEGDKADETEKVTDKTKDAIKDAAEKAGAQVEELDDKVKGTDPVKDEDIPEGAKPRFPCPTADPEALAAAEVEPGIPSLPDEPWVLESSLLTLTGLDYEGIVEVKTGSGKIKKALKFTASGVDIKDLHQTVVGPNGTTMHVEASKGSTSKIRNGKVTMYTEELKGNLFGLIPVTFSPETPPPLNVPFAFFTNVKVTQAAQFGGTLTVPGLHNYFTGGNAG
ncbi:hypothetical protein [Streptomyces sp. NPDC059828]|uniref:hypothetical protein n=1 Tax=Streptomyces sp. NPDC059828 TaxID=3346965 RepID=UPI00365206EB